MKKNARCALTPEQRVRYRLTAAINFMTKLGAIVTPPTPEVLSEKIAEETERTKERMEERWSV